MRVTSSIVIRERAASQTSKIHRNFSKIRYRLVQRDKEAIHIAGDCPLKSGISGITSKSDKIEWVAFESLEGLAP